MEKKDKAQSLNPNALEYIQINHKNQIGELSFDMRAMYSSFFLNSLTQVEENLGGEINNFFLSVLPENKEGETLKVITKVANKTKTDKNILHKCLTKILNMSVEDKITLNRDVCEDISIVLKEIFRKIKKKMKIKNFGDIKKCTQNYMDNFQKEDILKKFKVSNSSSSKTLGLGNIYFKNNNNGFKILNKNIQIVEEEQYEYKEIKLPKNITLPIEMIILLRKFSMVKTLRLSINNDYFSNNEEFSRSNEYFNKPKKNELENIILILFNVEWLFPSLVGLELDLSNINITESQIDLYKYTLDEFSKLINKEVKITSYQISNNNKRSNDSLYKSTFSQYSSTDELELVSDRNSTSTSSNIIIFKQENDYNDIQFSDEQYHKAFKQFVKKYMNLMEIMIIYSYFAGKMENIIYAKFIMPINLGDEIFYYLKNKNIFINDFHILSYILKKNLINFSIEFNSLDGQTFEKVLNFLNQNQNLCRCHLSFFPEEELFKTELLFKLLQSNDDNFKLKKHKDKNNKLCFNSHISFNTNDSESLEDYILRKLSYFFEKNIQNLFYLLTLKTNIMDLCLIFDIPTLLIKNGFYNNILIKFFLDVFILLDSSVMKNLQRLSLIAEDFIFDSRKYPALNDFCDKLNFYKNKRHKLDSLIFQAKIYRIPKIYRFIPYNITYLSLGSLDYETFYGLTDYLTSSDFGIRTKLKSLKLSLNNSLIDINYQKLNETIIRLLTDYPKKLKEISLFSFIIVSYEQLCNILIKTNYNTLPNIFLQFSVKSIMYDEKLRMKLESDLSNATNIYLKIENFMELYNVKRDEKQANKIVNLLMNLGRKNKDILQYDIFYNIEKFLCQKERKKLLIQFR